MNLKAWLAQKRLSVRDFARLSGLSHATVSRIANGKPASLASAKLVVKATKGKVRFKDME